MGRLEGKVAFVTAAGGAIAGATARLFGSEGAAVACIDTVEENVNKTSNDIEAAGGKAIPFVCDVTDDDAVKSAVSATAAEFGRLDICFNAAAYSEKRHRLAEMPLDMWKSVIDVNLTGMFIVARHVIPRMQEAGGGSIINVSSIYGVVGAKERPAYCAAKGGVRMLSKSIAVDYAADNIRANSIMPGPIETPRLLARNPSIEAVIDRHGPRLHQKRLGKPEEIAKTALFLASDDASFTSGADMVVDAAYTAF
jgi:NAD(P)-dependent dehydrogenase (short-subunit alcohol dehydrogenase family)